VEGSTDQQRLVDAESVAIGQPSAWWEQAGLDPRMTCVSMGNPHVIYYCTAVEAIPLEEIGPLVETHPSFPRRINVHFVERQTEKRVKVRTWERGTGITQACGTGASNYQAESLNWSGTEQGRSS
jgi:diaminopimelate epimerase